MTGWPEGYGRVILQVVDSTLDAAVRQLTQTPAPFWLLAHQQTAARGRRGRDWTMPEGSFAGTLMLHSQEPPANLALRSFVMSLALYHALVEVTGRENALSLKWPNDVLLNGGKVAGILLESAGSVTKGGLLSIGVGVNLCAAPDPSIVEEGAVRPVSIAGETSVFIGAEDFLEVLARQYAPLERQFQDFGFAHIRREWLARAARIGQKITARTSRDIFTGVFEDVDANGHLVLRDVDCERRIAAADVYFDDKEEPANVAGD